MLQQAKTELAPGGVLRAGLNLSNFLLVSGKDAAGEPAGVAPDMAAEIARRLGVPVEYVPYQTPGELADAAETGAWDIGLIGAEPQRAEKIAFTPAYVEIEATYLVPAGSPIGSLADVDKPGVRISVTGRSAYGLWLDRHIEHATLAKTGTLDSAFEQFVNDKLEVLAGLRPQAALRCREAARRPHPRRQIHRRAAGHRHGAQEYGGRRVPARVRGGGEGLGLRAEPDRQAQGARPYRRGAG